ncbi:hypothetical protein HAALTHF_25400n [Vreelandella aquamarina]|nr:hypothetical protein HAALTHF_25400n [Halomonas axialensis]
MNHTKRDQAALHRPGQQGVKHDTDMQLTLIRIVLERTVRVCEQFMQTPWRVLFASEYDMVVSL